MKKILTFEDLYNYYSSTAKDCHFSAKEEDCNIVVQVPGNMEFAEDEAKEGLLPVRLVAFHDQRNANGSFIETKTMKKALKSFALRPILGFIHEVDGEPQFYSHNMHIDDDGELVYDEQVVGVVAEKNNAHIEYDEEADVNRAIVDGYIFEEYTKAADILRREEKCKCSVELNVKELSYDSKSKDLILEDFVISGITILGFTEEGVEVQEGMKGSNITIADFSKKNNSYFSDDISRRLDGIEKKLEKLSNFNIDKDETEGGEIVTKFEELLEKYSVTVEDVTFEYEDLDDEALETAFAEAFEKEKETQETEETESFEDDEAEAEEEAEVVEDEETEDEGENEPEDEGEVEEFADNTLEYTVTVNGEKRSFAVSLLDKLNALNTLVNDTYGEADNAWYSCDAIDEEKIVYMHDYWNDKHYRQAYSVKKDVYSLKGDRVEVFANFLTKDEEKALEDMKANYAEASEKLAKYEAEPEKVELINSEAYANIRELDSYKEIANDHFDLSVEDINSKLDSILLEYAKGNEIQKEIFAEAEEKKDDVKMVQFTNPKSRKTTGRYGSIFTD